MVFERPLNLSNPSSQIGGGRYDPVSKTLTLHLNGGTYEYYGVPERTVSGLESSDSPGSFFHKAIRTTHEYKRL